MLSDDCERCEYAALAIPNALYVERQLDRPVRCLMLLPRELCRGIIIIIREANNYSIVCIKLAKPAKSFH